MKSLRNIKKGISEIAIALSKNEEIQKYLLVDSTDVENATFEKLGINDLFDQNYICICPQHENAIKDMGRNTMIILFLQDIDLKGVDNNYISSVAIHCVTDIDHARINNNKDRALEIADLVVQTIDGMKLSSAGAVEATYISHVTYSEFTTGYKVSVNFTDQPTKKAEL